MSKDFETDLRRLFAEIPEPDGGEEFTRRVSGRIARRRLARRAVRALLAGSGLAALALLGPWAEDLTRYITLGSDYLTDSTLAVILSPAGWALSGALGLLVILRAR